MFVERAIHGLVIDQKNETLEQRYLRSYARSTHLRLALEAIATHWLDLIYRWDDALDVDHRYS